MRDNLYINNQGFGGGNRLVQGKSSLDSNFQSDSAANLSETVQMQSTQQTDPLQARLDRIEETYRAMIASSRGKGYDVAADNLQRFLDGRGGTKQESVNWLRDFRAITSAERTNLDRFENSLKDQALKLNDGETKRFSDYWDRTLTGSALTELFYASGTSTITSTGNFTLRRSGDTITITGSVTHEWNDPYDWHAELAAYVPGYGTVSDADALLLQQHRGAAPFHMTASWDQTLTGSYEIDSFLYFDSSNFNWSEVGS